MMDTSDSFAFLRPFCVAVASKPSKEGMKELQVKLKDVPQASLQDLQDYVLYPLRLGLKNQERSRLHPDMIDTIRAVLARTTMLNWNMFQDLFSTLFMLISSPGEIDKLSSVNEELKLAVALCATELLDQSSNAIHANFYAATFTPRLAHAVFISLQLASDEKMVSLRIAAMQFILAASRVGGCEWKKQARECFAMFLPRIASRFAAVAKDDGIVNHKVIVTAIKVWREVVAKVMDDCGWKSDANQSSQEEGAKIEETSLSSLIRVAHVGQGDRKSENTSNHHTSAKANQILTQEWYKDTSSKLDILLAQMALLTGHPNPKVRRELSLMTHSLLVSCSQTMSPCVSTLVKMAVEMTEDSDNDISRTSREVLDKFATECQVTGGKKLLELVEEDLYALVTRMPGIFNKQDASRQQSCLKLLCGYLRLLGPKLNHVLSSPAHLNRLLGSLLHCCQLDTSRVPLLQEWSEAPDSSWRQFKLIHDGSVKQHLKEVCVILGSQVDSLVMCDYLLDKMSESIAYMKESVMCLNWAMQGFRGKSDSGDVVQMVLSEYVSPEVWKMQTKFKNTSEERDYVVTCCLLLEGVTEVAILCPGNFRLHLTSILYDAMERFGSEHSAIQTCASRAMAELSHSCGYRNVSELIADNVHVFSHKLSLRVRNLPEHPDAAAVLSVAVQTCGDNRGIWALIQDRVQGVLMQSADQHHTEHANVFLSVFHSILVVLSKRRPAREVSTPGVKSLQDIMRDYHRANQLLHAPADDIPDDMPEDINPAEEPPDFPEEEEKPPLPSDICTTVNMLNRTLHLLPSGDIHRKLLAIEVLDIGIQILSSHEDELLPMAHRIWGPLLGRLAPHSDARVIKGAFRLLQTFGRTCGMFMRRRTLEAVLPNVTKFLQIQAKATHGKGCSHAFTQGFKLQRAVLSGVGELCRDLQLRGENLDSVLDACVPYLSRTQPDELQSEAVKAYKTIKEYEPAAVWLKLSDLWSEPVWSESDMLEDIEVAGSDDVSSEFYSSVKAIL